MNKKLQKEVLVRNIRHRMTDLGIRTATGLDRKLDRKGWFSRFENHPTSYADRDTLVQLAQVLKTTVEWLQTDHGTAATAEMAREAEKAYGKTEKKEVDGKNYRITTFDPPSGRHVTPPDDPWMELLVQDAVEILQSHTPFAHALASNIRCFKDALDTQGWAKEMEQRLAAVETHIQDQRSGFQKSSKKKVV